MGFRRLGDPLFRRGIPARYQLGYRKTAGGELPFSTKVAALNPSLWWKMNEASGTTITDYGTFAKNGTFTAGSGALGAVGIGDGLTSITFDGTATNIAVGGNPSLTMPASGTVMVWWKSSSMFTDGTARGIRFDRADSANYIRLLKDTGNFLRFQCDFGNAGDVNFGITPNTTSDWFLLAGTWTPSATNLYQILKGGATVVTGSGAGVGTWSAGAALWQMSYAGTFLQGTLAHMLIVPSALTQTQLVNLAKI